VTAVAQAVDIRCLQGKAQAMLLVHLVLPTVTDTCCSRTVALQEQNVMEHSHAWTINGSTSCSSYGRTFRWELWSTAPVTRGGRKKGPRYLSAAVFAWIIKVESLSILFDLK